MDWRFVYAFRNINLCEVTRTRLIWYFFITFCSAKLVLIYLLAPQYFILRRIVRHLKIMPYADWLTRKIVRHLKIMPYADWLTRKIVRHLKIMPYADWLTRKIVRHLKIMPYADWLTRKIVRHLKIMPYADWLTRKIVCHLKIMPYADWLTAWLVYVEATLSHSLYLSLSNILRAVIKLSEINAFCISICL